MTIPTDPRTRVLDKFTVSDGCWLWTGARFASGYGSFNDGTRTVRAHRFVYEWLVGPIPDGMQLDHTCHNDSGCGGGPSCLHRRCVRPAHLEPVTHLENGRRGEAGAWLAAKTECPSGHAYDEANTRIYQGRRYCRACSRVTSSAYHSRKAQHG